MADNGHDLWLKSAANQKAQVTVTGRPTPTIDVAKDELQKAWKGDKVTLTVGGEAKSDEAFTIEISAGKPVITSKTDRGVLYGAYHLLRLQAIGANVSDTTLTESPAFDIRILNHWDNLDGTVERGYAGKSIWHWDGDSINEADRKRYELYAKANASIGINATVINNVNASPEMLSEDILKRVAEIADILRPYGIKTFLSVNFSSPIKLAGTVDADPLRAEVRSWWKTKADEIYDMIPDFGGFLVKANSEGLPGPLDYGRTHVDGANMLAEALAPHNGVVLWRAFVYSPTISKSLNSAKAFIRLRCASRE